MRFPCRVMSRWPSGQLFAGLDGVVQGIAEEGAQVQGVQEIGPVQVHLGGEVDPLLPGFGRLVLEVMSKNSLPVWT